MRKTFLLLFLFIVPGFLMAQQVIQSFDTALDTSYWGHEISVAADSTKGFVNYSLEETEVQFGSGAQLNEYSAHNIEPWGGYSKIEYVAPGAEVMDWSAYDSVSFWYNNITPQDLTGRIHLRFELYDVSDVPDTTSDASATEFYYSFHYILDNAPGWNEIKMPLVDGRAIPELDEWGGEAFNRTGWSGVVGNDKLDKDKIKGFAFEFSISGDGNGDVGMGAIILDHLTLKGSKNALAGSNPGFEMGLDGWDFAEGGGYRELRTEGAAQGDNFMEIGVNDNAWAVSWHDSIPATAGATYIMSALIKDVSADDFTDGYALLKLEAKDAANNLITDFGGDQIQNPGREWGTFSTQQTMPAGTHYITVVVGATKWTGDGLPAAYGFDEITLLNLGVADTVASDPPANVNAAPDAANHFNLVIWEDVPGESGEIYTVYASENPITDLNAEGVELIASSVDEDIQSTVHYLRYPLKDKSVDYYYAVTCTDASANVSEPGVSTSATTNMAEGVPTFAEMPPAGFVADGDITEWENSGIVPFVITPETDYAFQSVTDANDLTGTIYLAFDDANLYFFADVVDDVHNYGDGNWWDQDAFQMFFGLYNQTSIHTGVLRGDEPDFIIYSNEAGLNRDNPNGVQLYTPAHDNYYFEQFGGADYVVEAKIPFDSLYADGDGIFTPMRGMRIPLELYFHDNDGSWEGNLGISPNASDLQWQTVEQWTYTWIGDTNAVVTAVEDEIGKVAGSFALKQNYPNPFNPTTTIEYHVATAGNVKLTVFNLLGQQVEVLLDARHTAGTHFIKFDATNFASGVYFYKIESGDFVQTKKMLIVK
ncbi:MAG: T9SS C-terminal target domain-containing protein [Calditrichaeota bacterium]|nr:MAG: T9SS C-terminal target domain-containing protein [Calditrichota bacterium]MBL1205189.1 T9SS C-terminal target domain-containing protein [Calditrichota bacterium]NOG45019.1 T9SS type A sorting domain-containing protein [Calditrichota bacterium]